MRVLMITFEYTEELEIDVTECIFCLRILFKVLKYFNMDQLDLQLISTVQEAVQDKAGAKSQQSSLFQSFSSYFKRKESIFL